MKTSASPQRRKDAERSALSFVLAACVYLLILWGVFWAAPALTYTPAGQMAAVSLSFAQFSGGSAAAEEAPEPTPATAPEPAEEAPPPEPEPEPAVEPEPEVQPDPEPEPEPIPEPEPEPEPIPEPEPEPAPVPEPPPPPPEPKPKPEPKPEPKPVEKPVEKPKPVKKAVKKTEVPKPVKAAKATVKGPDVKPAAAPAAPAGPAPVQSAGAPVSAGQEGISELVYGQTTDPFLAEVKRAVESALHYPRKARMFHIEGTAVVQFIVDSNGKLTELKIFKSAGHPLLDKAAMRAVADAESNWSRPKGTVRLRFPIQFKLQS